MATLRRIVKYTPAVVLALLTVAWVLSIFRNIGFYSTNPLTRDLATVELSDAEIFFRMDRRVFSNVEFAVKRPHHFWDDTTEAEDIFGSFRFIDNAGGAFEHVRTNLGRYAVRIPILLLMTAVLPLAIGSFISFRFRLWHYFAYTALIALDLAYYLRWQE